MPLIFVSAAISANTKEMDRSRTVVVTHLEASKYVREKIAVSKLPIAAMIPTISFFQMMLLLFSTHSTPFTARIKANINPSPMKLETPRSNIF
jgi:hypothetical protein